MDKGKLNYSIDRTTGVPPFLQIVEQVKDSLYTGRLVVGDHLPSVSEVVKMTAVNANTVMKAYRELEYAGVAQPIQGVGTVVTSLPMGANPQLLKIYQARFEALINEARQDGLDWEPLQHLVSTIIREMKLMGRAGESDKG
jgi:GntR family transcriptional regulator